MGKCLISLVIKYMQIKRMEDVFVCQISKDGKVF